MTEPVRRRRDTRTIQAVIAAIALIYAILFIVLNAHRVKVSFVFFSTQTSLIFALLLSLAVGFVLGSVGPRLYRHRQR
jgi:uncharacterized integral membrane protein